MHIDLAKRRTVMQRSLALGHCVCDPRKPCPCDVFTDHGYCPCAGERPDPAPLESIQLTQLVRNAGCASKIAPGDLDAVLSSLPPVTDPAVLSGVAAGEDAAIYRLDGDTCLIQTVDVMTPCVDDPEAFGRICAANCLSDIYAMGGQPRTALSVVAFPSETLDTRLIYLMLKGAMHTLAEAGVALVGGHSIKDTEIKLGFAVTGTISAQRAVRQDRARAGDVLVLTKALGTGVIGFAQQIGRATPQSLAAAQASMTMLNRDAALAMQQVGVSACTDVTGFGLFAHLLRLLRHSQVAAEVWAEALPAFPGAVQALRDGVIPGAIERNREYVGDDLEADAEVDPALVHLGFDAQTSGGLLIAVPEERHQALLDALAARQVPATAIGLIAPLSLLRERAGVRVLPSAPSAPISPEANAVPAASAPAACCSPSPPSAHRESAMSEPCCDHPPVASSPAATGGATSGGGGGGAGSVAEAQRAFGALMRATSGGGGGGGAGALDARTRELITFALVLLSRCGPCVKHHLARARQMGITPAELDEAAWCAIAMGGVPVKMFYDEATK